MYIKKVYFKIIFIKTSLILKRLSYLKGSIFYLNAGNFEFVKWPDLCGGGEDRFLEGGCYKCLEEK